MGLLGTLVKAIGALLLVVIGLGAYLYFTDYAAEATITDRSARCPPGEIVVTPNILPTYGYTTTLECDTWNFVCEGYEVTFRLQTKAYVVRDDRGREVYDSATGRADTIGLARCAAGNIV